MGMAAQRKKGKNSQKNKAAKPESAPRVNVSVAQPTAETAASAALTTTTALETGANNGEAVEVLSDNAANGAENQVPPAESSLESSGGQHAPKETQETSQDAVQEHVQEPAQELAPEAVQEPVQEPTQESSQAQLNEEPQEMAQEVANQASPEPPQEKKGDYTSAPEFRSENFSKNEIKTFLVPVSPFHRLIAASIVIVSYSILAYLTLNAPPSVNAHGLHAVDLPEPGAYVLIFKGDLQDPYGWTVDGRFRNSLEIEMEPIEPEQKVEKIEPFKDLSGADFFSVAEYEVNRPGTYNLWVKWLDPKNQCKGRITLEKDPVERFIFKWATGIVGTIALFFMCGIPMTTSKAQATLPSEKPPA